MAEKKLGKDDETFINEYVGSDQKIVWKGWVKKFKGNSGSINKKYSVRRDGHFYDLKEISVKEDNRIKIDFVTPKLSFCVDFKHDKQQEIVKIVREMMAVIKFGEPESNFPALNLPANLLLPIKKIDQLPIGGLMEAYRAQCNYDGLSVEQNVIETIDSISKQSQMPVPTSPNNNSSSSSSSSASASASMQSQRVFDFALLYPEDHLLLLTGGNLGNNNNNNNSGGGGGNTNNSNNNDGSGGIGGGGGGGGGNHQVLTSSSSMNNFNLESSSSFTYSSSSVNNLLVLTSSGSSMAVNNAIMAGNNINANISSNNVGTITASASNNNISNVDSNSTVQSLCKALRFNTYFISLEANGLPSRLRDIVEGIGIILQTNSTLTSVTLQNLIASSESSNTEIWSEFGQRFSENPKSSLAHLILSAVGSGVAGLSSGLKKFKTPLLSLDLSYNTLAGKPFVGLLISLDSSSSASHLSKLERLNLSGNVFDNDSSQALMKTLKSYEASSSSNTAAAAAVASSSLSTSPQASTSTVPLSSLPQATALKFIGLIHTNIDLKGLCVAMNRSCLELRCLDISHNRIDINGMNSLCAFIASSVSVNEINISDTNLPLEGGSLMSNLLLAILQNRALKMVSLDVSENELGHQGAQAIAFKLLDYKTNCNIHNLKLNGCNLTVTGLVTIANALLDNTFVKVLSLDRNLVISAKGFMSKFDKKDEHLAIMGWGFKVGQQRVATEAATAFAMLLSKNTSLTHLSIKGDAGRYWGADLAPLLSVLPKNTGLTWIAIDGNRIGDEGFNALCHSISHGSHIREISLDDNYCSISSLQNLAAAIRTSTDLCILHIPLNDIKRMLENIVDQDANPNPNLNNNNNNNNNNNINNNNNNNNSGAGDDSARHSASLEEFSRMKSKILDILVNMQEIVRGNAARFGWPTVDQSLKLKIIANLTPSDCVTTHTIKEEKSEKKSQRSSMRNQLFSSVQLAEIAGSGSGGSASKRASSPMKVPLKISTSVGSGSGGGTGTPGSPPPELPSSPTGTSAQPSSSQILNDAIQSLQQELDQ